MNKFLITFDRNRAKGIKVFPGPCTMKQKLIVSYLHLLPEVSWGCGCYATSSVYKQKSKNRE